jgi:hypothetical protein
VSGTDGHLPTYDVLDSEGAGSVLVQVHGLQKPLLGQVLLSGAELNGGGQDTPPGHLALPVSVEDSNHPGAGLRLRRHRRPTHQDGRRVWTGSCRLTFSSHQQCSLLKTDPFGPRDSVILTGDRRGYSYVPTPLLHEPLDLTYTPQVTVGYHLLTIRTLPDAPILGEIKH